MSTQELIGLLRKYDVAGPRYTSYPTVPNWERTPTEAQWLELVGAELAKASAEGVGAGVYVHVPFCESLCTYCGCNTRITRNRNLPDPYIDAVLGEWELYRQKLGVSKIPLGDLHYGGGTPTFLSLEQLERLTRGVLQRCEPVDRAEYALEADPRVTSAEQLKLLAGLGFKRLSLGIQDFDSRVQDIVNRHQTVEQVREVTETARKLGFTSINYDLIYGLPLQTQESVRQTVEAVRALRPDRIAFYSYAHVPWIKPGQRRFTEADLPVGDAKRALYELGRELLEGAGYHEVGMDHFALETDDLWLAWKEGRLHRNFMGYVARRVSPLFGLGVSGIGDCRTAYAQNEKHLETYEERVRKGELPILRGHVLDAEDRFVGDRILDLMTRLQTAWSASPEVDPFLTGSSDRLKPLVDDGLAEFAGTHVRITTKGRAFMRNICMAFDARLARSAPKLNVFSRTM